MWAQSDKSAMPSALMLSCAMVYTRHLGKSRQNRYHDSPQKGTFTVEPQIRAGIRAHIQGEKRTSWREATDFAGSRRKPQGLFPSSVSLSELSQAKTFCGGGAYLLAPRCPFTECKGRHSVSEGLQKRHVFEEVQSLVPILAVFAVRRWHTSLGRPKRDCNSFVSSKAWDLWERMGDLLRRLRNFLKKKNQNIQKARKRREGSSTLLPQPQEEVFGPDIPRTMPGSFGQTSRVKTFESLAKQAFQHGHP